jgi:hypothetical protein
MNSTCTSKREEKKFLLELLGYKSLETTNLYRGSIHGWKCKHFHSRCDNKGPTIALFKVKGTEECIGGYTELSGHLLLVMVSLLVIVVRCCSTCLAKGTSQTKEQARR